MAVGQDTPQADPSIAHIPLKPGSKIITRSPIPKVDQKVDQIV